ncbi:unnamed protein product [Calypogeia fissa]
MPFYAIARGHRPGIYTSWDEAKKQVEKFPKARHKKFATEMEALAFIAEINGAGDVSNHTNAAQGSGQAAAPRQVPLVQQNLRFSKSGKVQNCVEDGRLQGGGGGSDPNPMDSSTLVAFTDGSALSNGTANSRAGWACVFPHNQAWNRAEPLQGSQQTNNRAEYRAAIEALKRANIEDPLKVQPIYIFSDSMLLIRSMTEWIKNWIARGWRKSDGQKVLNDDLLKELLEEQGKRRIIWQHVPAHTNGTDWKSKWNDLADQMAKEQAANQ